MLVETIASDALAGRAGLWLADRIWSAIALRGGAHVAVSGGTTPAAMFNVLASLPVPWPAVHIWQVDERVAPDGDPNRNANQLHVFHAAHANVHQMEVTSSDLAAAAAAFGDAIHRACGGVFDVVHLGLGDDGHTASWPPGDPVVGVSDRDVALSAPYKGHARMTLTPPVVNRAHAVMFLVSGAAKAPALAKLLRADPSIPASAVRMNGTTVLTDPPAMGAT